MKRDEESIFNTYTVKVGDQTVRVSVSAPTVRVSSRLNRSRRSIALNAEFILALLLSKSEQDGAIGDFRERYNQKVKRLGRRRADLWAIRDVGETVWPVIKRTVAKAAAVVGIIEWVRGHLL